MACFEDVAGAADAMFAPIRTAVPIPAGHKHPVRCEALQAPAMGTTSTGLSPVQGTAPGKAFVPHALLPTAGTGDAQY